MTYCLDLNEKNKITVMLVQALWGAISPNFRMVAISLTEPKWRLCFVLENECSSDREEIEDVAGEFDALLLNLNTGVHNFEVDVTVNAAPLPPVDPKLWRTVYRRRES